MINHGFTVHFVKVLVNSFFQLLFGIDTNSSKHLSGHLAEEGAKIVILDRAAEVGEQIVSDIKAKGGEASFFLTDVLNKEILEQNKKEIIAKYGRIDALLNAAGGNMAGATIGPDSTIFDLKAHQTTSGKSMEYLNPTTGEKIIPYVIEPSLGADRAALAFLCEAYEEQALEGGDTRVVMHFHPALAPYKCAVLPLQKNKCGEKAGEIHDMLSKHFMVDYDETGSIGKRYRRQDEIGTPMCITVDFDTLETGVVTVRDRDTMEQDHVHVDELVADIQKKIEY